MLTEEIMALAAWAGVGAAVIAALAEGLHARRVRRLGRLAFGPDQQARAWTQLAPPLRVLALAGVTWALVALLAFEGSSRARERNAAATRHLLVLLDVSPSMELKDAGEGGAQSRRDRAAALLKSVMGRASSDQVKITMACFYSDALLLVKECGDRELIWNFADNLPLHIAYRPGKTDLVKSLNTAGELVKDFPRKSTTVLVLTDGDAVPDTGLKPMPSAVAKIIFAGVGDPTRGMFIDGHLSRQDQASLSQLARRLGGHYHNGNLKHVPSELLRRLNAPDQRADKFQINLRVLAILVLAAGAALLCLLPVALEHWGSAWKPAATGARAREARPAPEPVEVAA
jgi:Ca-activated chloride channel family protein